MNTEQLVKLLGRTAEDQMLVDSLPTDSQPTVDRGEVFITIYYQAVYVLLRISWPFYLSML